MHISKLKKANLKRLHNILYESNYIAFSESQRWGENKKVSGCLGLGVGEE